MTGMDRRRFLSALGRAGLATWTLTSTPAWARAAVTKAAKVAKPPPPPAELIERNAWPEHYETTLAALGHSWTTRNDRFFVRSHLPVPTVDPASYRLEVSGLVRTPLSLSLAEIQALPSSNAPV
ncbi:MAG: oxidase, partial [Candidatus Eisenbacteria bacterium]